MNKGMFKKIGELFKTSVFFGFFIWLAEFFYSKICRSLTSKLLSSYHSYGEKYNKSIAKRAFDKIWIKKQRRLRIKNRIQRYVEKSFSYKILRALVNLFLAVKVRIYGVVLFIWGFCSVSVGVIKTYVATFVDSDFFLIYQGIALIVFAVPLLASRSDMGYLLAHGKITGYFLCDVIGIKPEKIVREPIEDSAVIPVFLGILFGVSSLFVDPSIVFIGFFAFVYVLLVFHKPEFGTVVTVFTVPFFPTMAICAEIILVFIAFLCKVIRGKRSIRFGALDIAVAIFTLFILLGGLFSASVSTSLPAACVFVCFIMSYFLIANLINNERIMKKMLVLMIAAFFICSAVGVYQNFFGVADTTWTDTDMFSDIETRVVSTFENPNVFGEYLIMLMPIVVSYFIISHGLKNKSALAIVLSCGISALVFTWSRGAWLGLIFSLLLYLMVINKRAIALYLMGVAALPFALPFLPTSILERFSSIGDMTDTSTSYRVYIWEAVGDMLGDWWLGGIGVGTGAFGKVYPSYALSGIEAAPHSHNLYFQIFLELGIFGFIAFLLVIFLSLSKCSSYLLRGANREIKLVSSAATVGILAILVQGLTDYVWYNYRVFLMFWIVLAIASASVNCAESELNTNTEDLQGGQNEKTAEIEISL